MPVLAFPAFERSFDVTTDASIAAVGGELVQGGRPVAFFSKKLTPAENRYHVTDGEMMGMYLTFMKWR